MISSFIAILLIVRLATKLLWLIVRDQSGLLVRDKSRLVVCGFTLNISVESSVLVGGVLDGAPGTIRLDQGVAAFDAVSIAGFVLRLDITGVAVVHIIREFVVWVGVVVIIIVMTTKALAGQRCILRIVRQ